MHDVADKYDCNKYIKYNHSIKAAVWNESNAKWEVTVEKSDGITFVDEVDIFINAGGVLKFVIIAGSCLTQTNLTAPATGSGLTSRVSKHSRASYSTRHAGTKTMTLEGSE